MNPASGEPQAIRNRTPLVRSKKHLMLSASTLTGDEVTNRTGDKLGHIKDLVIDTQTGQIQYAVMSTGGFLGLGDRLFALPWKVLDLDPEQHSFILDVGVERLKKAPGFDKDHWPDMGDQLWAKEVSSYYERRSDSAPPGA
jgi:sporulation protein YlmC with PRC-barrel domain